MYHKSYLLAIPVTLTYDHPVDADTKQSEAIQNVEVLTNICSKTSVLKQPTGETEALDNFQNKLNQLKVITYQHNKTMDGLKNPSHTSHPELLKAGSWDLGSWTSLRKIPDNF